MIIKTMVNNHLAIGVFKFILNQWFLASQSNFVIVKILAFSMWLKKNNKTTYFFLNKKPVLATYNHDQSLLKIVVQGLIRKKGGAREVAQQ